MVQPITATPVVAMDCNIPDCRKQKKDGYKTKVGLTNHMKRWHQVAKDAFSPLAETARTLFQNNEDDSMESTQGNSRGEVNVIKVVSNATFVCGVCELHFVSKKDMNEHMKIHGQNELNPEEEEQEGEVDEELDIVNPTKEMAVSECTNPRWASFSLISSL